MVNTVKDGVGHPPAATADIVVPLGLFDDPILKRVTILYTTFLFNDVLDVARLQSSLETLVEQDGWRKLGARLRRNRAGSLEHHIPVKFTKDRPAVRFYHVKHHMARADHPVASKIPDITVMPEVMADPNDFETLFLHPYFPTELRHYLERDEPQLGLLVVSFDDSTVVSLSWPHSLFDAMGLGEFLHAWSLMLQGRSIEIPTPYGVDRDPLAKLGLHPTEPHKLECLQLSRLGLVFYGLRNLFDFFFRRKQSRMIYVPASFIRGIREKALRELSSKFQDRAKQFLSEGDVLCAWWAKVMVPHLPSGANKLIHLANALGWRPILAKDILPSSRPYISNAVGIISALVPLRDLLDKPLSYVAWQIRQCITDGRRREQVEAYAALWRKSPARFPPLFGNLTMHIITCSNWSKARLLELDFSAAIIAHDTTVSSNELGRPAYAQSCFRGIFHSNLLLIIGKDSLGGYWLTGFTNTKHWARIEEAIAQFGDVQS